MELLAALLLMSGLSAGLTAQQETPDFFADRSAFEFILLLDLDSILGDRGPENPDRPAEVGYSGPDGTPVWVPVTVRTRGNFRLDPNNCQFPPLQLDLPVGLVGSTIFDGQSVMRMVTHCQADAEHQQNVVEEYLAYRLYEVLTPRSIRARLAKVTYIHANDTQRRLTRYAFFVEDVGDMAARHGMELVELDGFHGLLADEFELGVHDVFQYMIGNTDWSLSLSQNVFFMQDTTGNVTVVPFDFDWSGFVNAAYAKPAPDVPVETVRDRFYMGVCRTTDHYAPVFQHFLDSKDAIFGLVQEEVLLSPATREAAIAYLNEFYDIIIDETAATSKIKNACRM